MRSRPLRSLPGSGGSLLCLCLALIAPRAEAIIVVDGCPAGEAAGLYRGFFQSSVDRARWGLVEFAVTPDRNRRFQGVVTMMDPSTGLGLPFMVDGTLAASCRFAGVGRSQGAKVEFRGTFQFVEGGGAIVDARYVFQPPPIGDSPPPEPDRGTSTLLRDFALGGPDTRPPNLNGMWDGNYESDGDGGRGTLALDVTQACLADGSGPSQSFTGLEIVDKGTDHELRLYFRGSIGSGNQVLVIGWSLMGDRFFVSGDYHPPDPTKPATGDFRYKLMFFDGSSDVGSFMIQQQLTPTDPCHRLIGD